MNSHQKTIINNSLHIGSLLLLTLLILFLNHYKYGIGDQIIHVPFIKDLLDQTLYPNDILVDNMYKKPTYFWVLFLPLFKVVGIEYGLFILQFFSLFLFLYIVYKLVYRLTKNSYTSYIAILFLIFEKHSFGFSSMFVNTHFIPRNFTIPLVIAAVYLYLFKKRALGYLVLGIVTNLHVLSIIPVFISFIVTDVLTIISTKSNRPFYITQFLISLGIFSIIALPLITKFSKEFATHTNNPQVDIEYQQYYNAVLTPITEIKDSDGWLMFLNAILLIVFSYIYLLTEPEFKQKHKSLLLLRSILIIGSVLVLMSLIFERISVNPLLLQLQLGRSAEFSLLIFIIILAHLISKLFIDTKNKIVGVFSIITGIIFSNIAFLIPIVYINTFKKSKLLASFALVLGYYILYLSIYNYINYYSNITPAIDIKIEPSENVSVQNWLRNNTSKEAIILSPHYIGGFTEPDFRTISERTNVLTNADIVETILNKNLLLNTIERINDVTGNSYNYLKYNDRLLSYYEEKKVYHKAVEENLDYIIGKYNIDFVIIESDYNLPAESIVYENTKYRVYQVD